VCWANYNIFERAYFIMQFIKFPKVYNIKFFVRIPIFIRIFQIVLRILALFPAITNYYFLRNIVIFH
jgi:hypothetical protein